MIQTFMVADSLGYPFYSKKVGNSQKEFEPELLSGLLSAIGTIGKTLFNKEIANVKFGENEEFGITIISKEIFGEEKSIYFVFVSEGPVDLKKARGLCTNIFIETKQALKNPQESILNIEDKINRILTNKFDLSTL